MRIGITYQPPDSDIRRRKIFSGVAIVQDGEAPLSKILEREYTRGVIGEEKEALTLLVSKKGRDLKDKRIVLIAKRNKDSIILYQYDPRRRQIIRSFKKVKFLLEKIEFIECGGELGTYKNKAEYSPQRFNLWGF